MSKIEKALNKARTERQSGNSAGQSTTGPGEGQLVTVSSVSSYDVDVHPRSSQNIALMQEPEPREKRELAECRIIHPGMEENGAVRTFREIRTRILQRSHGKNGVLMVTAVSNRSGGTFVALNLGSVFAFDAGKTALVMDCNLRHPWADGLFPASSSPGLTDYLEDPDMDASKIICPVGVERLRVITAGAKRGTATEYFTSPRMRQLLDGLRRRYAERFIIIDAPPMSESADTHILMELCDYVLLVVPYGSVTDAQLEQSIRAIDGKKFLGVVFNDDPQLPHVAWDQLVPSALREWVHRGVKTLKALRNAKKRT